MDFKCFKQFKIALKYTNSAKIVQRKYKDILKKVQRQRKDSAQVV